MSTKIDFNILLAKADKNTNNAHKLLEEKKLQSQKMQQKQRERNETLNKASALAFIKKKAEESRLRTEREARELLERKHQKAAKEALPNDATSAAVKQPAATKTSTSGVSKAASSTKTTAAAGAKQSTSASTTSHKKSLDSSLKQPAATTPKAKTAPSQPSKASSSSSSSSAVPSSKEKNKQPMAGKPPPPTGQSSSSHRAKAGKAAEAPPKLAMSYTQMLSMAETLHKEKLVARVAGESAPSSSTPASLGQKATSSSSGPPRPNRAEKSATASTAASSSSSSVSKLSAQQILLLKQKEKRPTLPSQTNAHEPKFQAKASHPPANSSAKRPVDSPTARAPPPTTSAVSSWDRIISDMKKKPVKNKCESKGYDAANAAYDEYEEEDEYDSEMEDFIDDDEVDANPIEKKEYSKCIQEIFNYNPKRYAGEDDDIDDMETDYHTQMKEEKRSLKLGILEDLEELKREAELEKKRAEKLKKRKESAEETAETVSNIKKIKMSKT